MCFCLSLFVLVLVYEIRVVTGPSSGGPSAEGPVALMAEQIRAVEERVAHEVLHPLGCCPP